MKLDKNSIGCKDFRFERACAVKAEVLTRRKPNSQYIVLKITVPIATRPIYAGVGLSLLKLLKVWQGLNMHGDSKMYPLKLVKFKNTNWIENQYDYDLNSRESA
ncbi:hypothetical protein PAAL109150_24995 [Paenibacillus alkaliterrae]